MTAVRLIAVVLATAAAALFPSVAAAAPPSNDNRADAQVIDGLPARVQGTTVDATTEDPEPGSGCQYGSTNSVYYSFRAGADGRVLFRLHADGDLDAVIDVFRRTRSQLEPLACQQTDEEGDGQIGLNVKDGETYLVRIAQRANSVSGTFTLLL